MVQNGQPSSLRRQNAALILRLLYQGSRAGVTVPELVRKSGLTPMTVHAILTQLEESRQIQRGPLLPSSGGRPAQSYSFAAGAAHAGILYARCAQHGAQLFLRAADLDGKILWAKEADLPTVELKSFLPFFDEMLAQVPTVRSLGLGLPGSESDGRMIYNDFPALAGRRVSQFYAQHYGLPLAYENDANAAAAGWASAHPGCGTIAYLYFPGEFAPGVGVVCDGQVVRGAHGVAGEIGKLPFGIDWRRLAQQPEPVLCDAYARVVSTVCAVTDPECVVLAGPLLRPALLPEILRRCSLYLLSAPRLELSEEFHEDFEAGMVAEALAPLHQMIFE